MKFQRSGLVAGIALTATIALTACGSDNTDTKGDTGAAAPSAGTCVGGTLAAQGSSAQKNAMAEWIKAYTASCSAAKIDYQPTGSGAGVKALISGLADFAGSDSALKDDEQPQADAKCASPALNLPMVVGPIAVVYNIQGADGLQLSPSLIAKIFSGKITKWNDPAIAAENSGAKLPDATIEAVHRSDESGTTDNFTKYLSKTAEGDWTYDHAKAWAAPGGTGAKGSDGIAAKLKSTPNTISYVELSFAENSDLQKAKIKNGAGEYVELTGDAAGKTIEGAKVTGKGNDLKLDIDYKTATAGAYPIVLATYEIVCSKYADAAKGKAVQGFLKYTSSAEGQKKLADLGYAPLPESVRTKVATSVAALS
ncbi:phosphate ABC transporter substrate-binding protein [Actinoplanes sp. SE50]|uniref:phosphate ABC transporter substrate-binding protein PstS n=1 Tax=unclassified Actinoplanes TaxID=2626549 RepID=UPI00023EDF40|nr:MULTISPECIES: phosphate ABC transporter substrate-binding protein PstS [unclassified Actinoplanes]AEV88849.1 Phosphate-binding protein pstS [Actinoplanes sp. SE50/110]ATO87255.1 phosphate ABC transporter substrate-binding protein [Actinoplanes sp. SE50]SLM04673.1 phosphate ABC transporter substrate-binding protein PstS [Actinoplanes sp. SE50/110]